MRCLCVLLLALSSLSISVQAADNCRRATLPCTYNPQPAEDDFILPMPGGLEMVFKKIVVPGSEFWGNPERLVKIGDIQGSGGEFAIFEGVQRLPVSGAFYDPAQRHWYYYLGKYEVTIGQYAALMGKGELQRGLEAFYQASAERELVEKIQKAVRQNREASLYKELSKPLVGLTWFAFQEFIRNYNIWCYATPACVDKLPRLPKGLEPGYVNQQGELPGFFRLPTELEWEYAARGGMDALQDTQSNGRPKIELPLSFEPSQAEKYAWVEPHNRGKGPTRVGRMDPVHGLFDIFGNVQEFTAEPFTAEIIQGKTGGLSVRGGSYQTEQSFLRASLRAELGLYELDANKHMVETRSPTTGIRLSIGSLVVPSREYRKDLVTEYQAYATRGVRQATPAGRSLDDTLVQGSGGVDEASETLDEALVNVASGDTQALTNQLESARRALEQANRKIEAGTFDICEKLAQNGVLILKTAGWHYARAEVRKELIEQIKSMDIPGRTQQIQKAQDQYEEHLNGFEDNFAAYASTVEELGGYPNRFVAPALERLRSEKAGDVLVQETTRLLEQHVARARQGVVDLEQWRENSIELALRKGVFRN